jgi:hypothetical protein
VHELPRRSCVVTTRTGSAGGAPGFSHTGAAALATLRARGFDDILEPLGPTELVSLPLQRPVPARNDADAVDPREERRRSPEPHERQVRRPVWALHVLIVGLALHNLVMSQLYRAGVRGATLSAIASWKDVLLVGALAVALWGRRGRGFAFRTVDWLALAFGAFIVVYAVIPQSVLGGGATHKGVLYGTRHDLLPVLAYFLGRALALTPSERSRVCRTALITRAAAVYARSISLPLSWWRHSAGWFSDQPVSATTACRGRLRTSSTTRVRRHLPTVTSTFLRRWRAATCSSSRCSAWLRGRRWGLPLAALLYAALLATHTRAALPALSSACS